MTTTAVPKNPAIPKAMIQSGLRRSLTTGVVGESVELAGRWSADSGFMVTRLPYATGKHDRCRREEQDDQERLRLDVTEAGRHFSGNTRASSPAASSRKTSAGRRRVLRDEPLSF
jgi:hypothetical protein